MNGTRRGRPPIGDTALGRRTVYLTEEELAALRWRGNGNISAGVRQALHDLAEYEKWHRALLDPATVAGPAPRQNKQH